MLLEKYRINKLTNLIVKNVKKSVINFCFFRIIDYLVKKTITNIKDLNTRFTRDNIFFQNLRNKKRLRINNSFLSLHLVK